jgi:hypothetical protein
LQRPSKCVKEGGVRRISTLQSGTKIKRFLSISLIDKFSALTPGQMKNNISISPTGIDLWAYTVHGGIILHGHATRFDKILKISFFWRYDPRKTDRKNYQNRDPQQLGADLCTLCWRQVWSRHHTSSV